MNYSQKVTRKAVLIGAPGARHNFLRGVKHDLDNVEQYLLSEKGGVFFKSEITTLYNPSYLQVKQTIENAIADYSLIYFSGHGFTDDDFERRIVFRDYNIPDTFLLNNSPRQLVVIDACRTFIQPGLSGIPQLGDEWSYFTGSPVRDIFNQHILNSPEGKTIVHSTQSGEYAYDHIDGGAFTSALLKVSTKVKAVDDYTKASLKSVLYHTENVLRKGGNPQVPEITYSEGMLTVPFAIGVPRFIQPPKPKSQPEVSSTSNVNWGGIGLVALVIWALASSD